MKWTTRKENRNMFKTSALKIASDNLDVYKKIIYI